MNRKIANDKRFYKKGLYIKIRNLYKEEKYSAVIKEATNFLDMYPNDINVRFMMAKSYRKLNRFTECINNLNYILKLELDLHALTELYYTYYYLNMYEEAIELLPLIYDTKCIKPHSVVISELVMKKQLGMNVKIKEGTRSDYIKAQILNYNEESAFSHIEEHLTENDENTALFNQKIDLKKLFDIIKENINHEKKVNTEEFMELHYFAIPNVGYNNQTISNFLKVVVVPNTNNILTMYPVTEVEIDYINQLNIDFSVIYKKEIEKVKTLSRIDKFNKKYNM
ncbi:MAG: hypothetical protein IKL65_00795 [Bacilli bacterium]|nr:hypothetical protein [Bacilli bacterium]